MSLHASIVMIEGDFLSQLSEIFERFEYSDTGNDREITSWDDTLQILSNWQVSRSRVLKAVCLQQGWSVILDPEMVMFADEASCSKVSSEFQTRIFGLICESTSGTYGFNFYNNQKVRDFLSVNGEVVEDFGIPMQEEAEFDKSQVFEADILKIMEEIGVDYNSLETVENFIVKELDEDGNSAAKLDIPNPTIIPQNRKPWWQFWE